MKLLDDYIWGLISESNLYCSFKTEKKAKKKQKRELFIFKYFDRVCKT